MKSVTLYLLFASVFLFFVSVRSECGDAPKEGEGEVKSWFKNIGCQIKKGAEDLGESAKPWADKIGESTKPWADKIGASAKDFGQNVAQKYDEIKHKLTDDAVASSTPFSPIIDAPTEKVPLAPLSGNNAAVIQAASDNIPDKTTPYPSISETPKSLDDRFLFQPNECPAGQIKNFRNECRPSI